MAREQCPRCGAQKHQLNKCPTCGFQRNQVYKEQTSNLKEAARERVGAHPKKSKKSIKPKRKTAKAGKRLAGSIYYGLITRTMSREWHHVK